jgi:uncharacterized lipoprotein YddW (UPF0748 family)
MTFTPISTLLLVLLVAGCVAAPVARAQDKPRAEVRGTWLTTTANTAISSPEKTAETMRRLREIGLNTVYVECWKNGYSEWPSEVMKKLIGVPLKINNTPAELQRDLLRECLDEARKNDLLVIAWMEYGFMAAYKDTNNELRALGLKEGWLTTTRDGNLVGKQNPFVWMNPLHPVPQQLLIDLAVEIVTNYDVDGVQLDDRIAMPVEMGYDPYTVELYRKEHNGAEPPENPRDPHWVRWRADKITEYARRFAAEVRKAAKRPIIISVSPAPYPWSLENYCCDWPKWFAFEGDARWDEYIPQNYRMNFDRTRDSIRECIDAIPAGAIDGKKKLLAGIRIVGDGPDMPETDLLKSIEYTREAGLGGHVLWFSRGVLDVYPDALRKFYNGVTRHPYPPTERK